MAYQNPTQGLMLVEEERKEGLARSNTKEELSTSVWDRLYKTSQDRRSLLKTGESAANQQRFKRTSLWGDAPDSPKKAEQASRPQTAIVHEEAKGAAGTPKKAGGRATYA